MDKIAEIVAARLEELGRECSAARARAAAPKPATPDELTAHHESAHYVLAWCSPRLIAGEQLDILGTERAAGRALYYRVADTPAALFEEGVMLLAGDPAEERFEWMRYGMAWEPDGPQALWLRSCAVLLSHPPRSDWRKARAIAIRLDRDDIEGLLRAMYDEAVRRVYAYWPAIEKLAHELVEGGGILQRHEVRAILGRPEVRAPRRFAARARQPRDRRA